MPSTPSRWLDQQRRNRLVPAKPPQVADITLFVDWLHALGCDLRLSTRDSFND